MAELKLTRVRTAKNGMNSYKADRQRSTGTVYFDKKMFNGAAPETLTIVADNIAEPVAKPAPVAANAPVAEPVAEQPVETVNA